MKNKFISALLIAITSLFSFVSGVLIFNNFLRTNNDLVANYFCSQISSNNIPILSISENDRSSKILWNNYGYVNYQVSKQYKTNNSKAIFKCDLSACETSVNNIECEILSGITLHSAFPYDFNDYLGVEFIEGSLSKMNGNAYSGIAISDSQAKMIYGENFIENFRKDDKAIIFKKGNSEKTLYLTGIYKFTNSKSVLSDIYNSFVLINDSLFINQFQTCSLDIIFRDNDVYGNTRLLNAVDDHFKTDNFKYQYYCNNFDVLLDINQMKFNKIPYAFFIVILFAFTGVLTLKFRKSNFSSLIFANLISLSIIFLFPKFLGIYFFDRFKIIIDNYKIFILSLAINCVVIFICFLFFNRKNSKHVKLSI